MSTQEQQKEQPQAKPLPATSSFSRNLTVEATQAKTLDTLTNLDKIDIMTDLTETEVDEFSILESMTAKDSTGKMRYPLEFLDIFIKKRKINAVNRDRLGRKEVVEVTKAPYQAEVEDRNALKKLSRLLGGQ